MNIINRILQQDMDRQKYISFIRKTLNANHPTISFILSYSGENIISINNLISRNIGKGNCSSFIDELVGLADKYGFILTLRAGKPPGMDGLETHDLIEFYRRHGFVPMSQKYGYGIRMIHAADHFENDDIDFKFGFPKGTYAARKNYFQNSTNKLDMNLSV